MFDVIAGEDISGSQVTSEPNLTGARSTSLVLVFTPMTDIPSGAAIELKLPKSNEVSVANKGLGNDCEFRLDGTPKPMQCEAKDQTVTWTTEEAISAYRAVQVKIEKVFNNPVSSEATETFEMRVFQDSSKSAVVDQQLTALVLEATAAPLNSEQSKITAVPAGSTEVGQETVATMSVRSAGTIR